MDTVVPIFSTKSNFFYNKVLLIDIHDEIFMLLLIHNFLQHLDFYLVLAPVRFP